MNSRAPLGRPRQIDRPAIVATTLRPPATESGRGRWSCREVGGRLGVSEASVARVWREYGLTPKPDGAFAFTVQPEMRAAAVSVVGVCLTPRIRAVALVLDEPAADPGALGGDDRSDSAAPRPGVRDFLRRLTELYRGRDVHLVVDDGGVQRLLLQNLPQLTDARVPVHFTLGTDAWLNLIDVWHGLMERDGVADERHPAAQVRGQLGCGRSTAWIAATREPDARFGWRRPVDRGLAVIESEPLSRPPGR